jgi:hypothetical protein
MALVADIEADHPTGDIFVITDNLFSHNSAERRAWLEEHPRIHHVFTHEMRNEIPANEQ